MLWVAGGRAVQRCGRPDHAVRLQGGRRRAPCAHAPGRLDREARSDPGRGGPRPPRRERRAPSLKGTSDGAVKSPGQASVGCSGRIALAIGSVRAPAVSVRPIARSFVRKADNRTMLSSANGLAEPPDLRTRDGLWATAWLERDHACCGGSFWCSIGVGRAVVVGEGVVRPEHRRDEREARVAVRRSGLRRDTCGAGGPDQLPDRPPIAALPLSRRYR